MQSYTITLPAKMPNLKWKKVEFSKFLLNGCKIWEETRDLHFCFYLLYLRENANKWKMHFHKEFEKKIYVNRNELISIEISLH